jgi:cytochrome P450
VEDLAKLIPLSEAVARGGGAVRAAAFEEMEEYATYWIEKRRAEPGDDLISVVIKSEVEGRPITTEEVYSIVMLLLFGGLDTVASMMGYVAWYLAENPEARHWLINNPDRIPEAIDEMIRSHGVSNTGRIVTHDMEFHGAQLKAGDVIQQPNCLYGLDDRINPDPLTVDFQRRNGQHRAFGGGVHSCPGNVLGRREIMVFLEEWLKRIPDFKLKPGTKPVTKTGMVNSVDTLWLSW